MYKEGRVKVFAFTLFWHYCCPVKFFWLDKLRRGTMSEMRYANTKILIVTRYWSWFRLLWVVPSLYIRSWDYRMNGPTTDLQRRWNGSIPVCVFGNRYYVPFVAWGVPCIICLCVGETAQLPSLYKRGKMKKNGFREQNKKGRIYNLQGSYLSSCELSNLKKKTFSERIFHKKEPFCACFSFFS